MSQNKRRIKDCWRADVVRRGDQIEVTFRGNNTAHTTTEQAVSLSWYQVRFLIREFKKTWELDKAERLKEIQQNDAVMPKESA